MSLDTRTEYERAQDARIERLESQVSALCMALHSVLEAIPDLNGSEKYMIAAEISRVEKVDE